MGATLLDRIEHIQTELSKAGRVEITALAEQLGVSRMTIRRDLEVLEGRGAVERIRGGAVVPDAAPFAERLARHSGPKRRIAEKLADLLGHDATIGVDASTTMSGLAPSLPGRGLTVVTNGIELFRTLCERPGVEVLLTGGRYDAATGSLVGPLATRVARDLTLRRLFVSAQAVDPVLGSSEATLDDAEAKLALADVSLEIVLAVDASKLDRRSPARALPPERVTTLVTDLDRDDHRLDHFRDRWTIL